MKFEQYHWDHFHDVVFDLTDVSPTQEELEALYETLPEDIKSGAVHWGLNDSVVRDNTHVYLEKQINNNNYGVRFCKS